MPLSAPSQHKKIQMSQQLMMTEKDIYIYQSKIKLSHNYHSSSHAQYEGEKHLLIYMSFNICEQSRAKGTPTQPLTHALTINMKMGTYISILYRVPTFYLIHSFLIISTETPCLSHSHLQGLLCAPCNKHNMMTALRFSGHGRMSALTLNRIL